jgi:hypothetical protein
MNERIRELAEQAEDWADSQNFYASDYRDYLMEKFAELIIRECAEIADTERPNLLGCGYITKTKGRLIQEHFGVEL